MPAVARPGRPYRVLVEESEIPVGERGPPADPDPSPPDPIRIHGSVDKPGMLVCTTDDCESYPDAHARLLARVAEAA